MQISQILQMILTKTKTKKNTDLTDLTDIAYAVLRNTNILVKTEKSVSLELCSLIPKVLSVIRGKIKTKIFLCFL